MYYPDSLFIILCHVFKNVIEVSFCQDGDKISTRPLSAPQPRCRNTLIFHLDLSVRLNVGPSAPGNLLVSEAECFKSNFCYWILLLAILCHGPCNSMPFLMAKQICILEATLTVTNNVL